MEHSFSVVQDSLMLPFPVRFSLDFPVPTWLSPWVINIFLFGRQFPVQQYHPALKLRTSCVHNFDYGKVVLQMMSLWLGRQGQNLLPVTYFCYLIFVVALSSWYLTGCKTRPLTFWKTLAPCARRASTFAHTISWFQLDSFIPSFISSFKLE